MALVDFGILAALPEEFLVNRRVFGSLREVTENAESWYRMTVKATNGRSYEVVASFLTEMGPLEAQDLTSKMIAQWDPAFIFLVGIAGSFSKDVRLGDVVVSQQIFYYDMGKADREKIKYRPQGYPCSMTLIRQLEAFTFDTQAVTAWQNSAKNSAAEKLKIRKQAHKKAKTQKKKHALSEDSRLKTHRPKVHFGTMASGSLVIASKGKQQELLALHGKILATEMEGAGLLNATFRQREIPTPAIVVKGISDSADKNKTAADELVYWRELAAENSSRLALAMIKRGRIRPLKTDQFELNLNRGDVADAKERIKAPVSLGMSLLAFPRLVRPLGPLTGLRLGIAASSGKKLIDVIELVVEYQDRNNQQQQRRFKRISQVDILEPILGEQIGVYLALQRAANRIEVRAETSSHVKTAILS